MIEPVTGSLAVATVTPPGEDSLAVLGTHGRPDGSEIMGGRKTHQFIHRRKSWIGRYHALRSWSADVADQVTKGGLVVDEQDPRLALTYHPECVWHAARHGDPVAATDDQLLGATAHHHLAPRMYQVSSRSSWTCSGGRLQEPRRFADLHNSLELLAEMFS